MHRCSVQDARFIKSLSLPIYISIDGSFFYTQELSAKGRRSCSCTTCIVYVNLFKDRFFLIVASFRKADAKVRTFSYTLQMFLKLFFIFFFLSRPKAARPLSCRKEGDFKGKGPCRRFLVRMSTCRCFRFKSGCKGKGLFYNYQMFLEVFFSFFSEDYLTALLRKEKKPAKKKTPFICESDCKDKNF